MAVNLQASGGPVAVVVNDDPVQSKVIAEILRQQGLEVKSYSRAEEALANMMQQGPPQLIVTDLYMPGIDGWRFCRLLRSPEYVPLNQTPLVVVSATFSGAETQAIASELGANAFMPVPFEVEQWGSLVQNLLAGRQYAPPCPVLIVDDDPAYLEMLQTFLVAHGYQPKTATNGERARQLFRTRAGHLVILDHHLPDVSGEELLVEFKRQDPSAVILMVTGDPDSALATRFMQKGAAAYAHKPMDFNYLITLCRQALRERALLRVEEVLEERTIQLRASEARYRSLAEELQEALNKVKTLSGLLPICAGCKKIRDDRGYWHQVENYIQRHSDARFSHSLCPECLKKYYPEIGTPLDTAAGP